MKKHRHRFQLLSYSMQNIHFRCSCKEQRTRATTAEERKKILEDHQKFSRRCKQMHSLLWNFSKTFRDSKDKWKKEGYELMCAVEKWAKKHPTVIITGCDDYCHAGAVLVLIPHEVPGEYWGTTVYLLQQFGPPAQFFLYPGHLDEMLSAIKKIKGKTKKPKREESFTTKFIVK